MQRPGDEEAGVVSPRLKRLLNEADSAAAANDRLRTIEYIKLIFEQLDRELADAMAGGSRAN